MCRLSWKLIFNAALRCVAGVCEEFLPSSTLNIDTQYSPEMQTIQPFADQSSSCEANSISISQQSTNPSRSI